VNGPKEDRKNSPKSLPRKAEADDDREAREREPQECEKDASSVAGLEAPSTDQEYEYGRSGDTASRRVQLLLLGFPDQADRKDAEEKPGAQSRLFEIEEVLWCGAVPGGKTSRPTRVRAANRACGFLGRRWSGPRSGALPPPPGLGRVAARPSTT
jgi:hypothetical protein